MTSFSEYRRQLADGLITANTAAPIPTRMRGLQGVRAGVVTRGIAFFIDVAAVVVFIVAVTIGIGVFIWLLKPMGSFRVPSPADFFILGVFVLWLMLTAAWATTGKTLGNHLMGLRVVNSRCQRVSWPIAAARAITCMAFPIGLGWALVARSNRSVQDVVFRTSAVFDWTTQEP